jgi:hypothetical protein|tara:strand:+ start:571 stop:1644 length:1074 start_codon:yes stop_codon:yes gene_type:complete
MIVESKDRLNGEGLVIYLFDKEQKISSTAKMEAATYKVKKEQVIASGELLLQSANDHFLARGQGGILTLKSRQGILLGPAETMILEQDKKTENTTMNLRSPILPFLAGLQMLTAVPPLITADELVEFEKQVAPRVLPTIDPRKNFEEADENEAGLVQRLTRFLAVVEQTHILAQVKAPVEPEIPFEDLFKPNKKRIIIKSSKGFYFDGVHSEMSYLGNVELKGKGMIMTAKEGMKVLFDPPPAKPKEDDAEKDDSPFSGIKGIGEIKQFTVAGGVLIKGNDEKGRPIEVRGGRAVYDAKSGKVTIRGADLSFRVAGFALRTRNKDGYVIISLIGDENIRAQTSPTGWETSLPDKIKK